MKRLLLFFVLWASLSGVAFAQTSEVVQRSVLRVCADPANLPFSNEDRAGYENKIADLIAEKLGVPVAYTWFPQATGFVRQTLRAKRCDIIMGYAQGHELVQNTNHYLRSSYVLLHRPGSQLQGIESLNDPRLKQARIGVIAGTPPGTILALNGLLGNVKGYHLVVDRRHFSPAQEMIDDLNDGDIDAAILWGPIGGYYAKRAGKALGVVPLIKETLGPRLTFRITFGIRRNEPNWKRQLNDLIAANQDQINKILLDYGVPILNEQDRLITQ